jgi:hypothetical protein
MSVLDHRRSGSALLKSSKGRYDRAIPTKARKCRSLWGLDGWTSLLKRPSPMTAHQTSTTPRLTCEISLVRYRKSLFFYAFQTFPAWPRRSSALSVTL